MIKRIFTYEEMKDRLPDYCFGNLTDEEQALFENSLPHYVDFVKEVDEIKLAFPVERKEQVNDFIANKARNISVKVNDALERTGLRKRYTLVKYLAPAFGLVLLFLIVFEPFTNILPISDNNIENKEISQLIEETQNPEELMIFVTDDPLSGETDLTYEIQTSDIDDVYNEMVKSSLFGSDIDGYIDIDNLNILQFNEDEMYSILEDLNNNDVELILEELKNAKIVS